MEVQMKRCVGLFLFLLLLLPLTIASQAFAEGDEDGVAGCQAVVVDPAASFEYQQAVCSSAEQHASSSCATTGHGMCSSPKKDGTLMDGTNCVCLSDETPVA